MLHRNLPDSGCPGYSSFCLILLQIIAHQRLIHPAPSSTTQDRPQIFFFFLSTAAISHGHMKETLVRQVNQVNTVIEPQENDHNNPLHWQGLGFVGIARMR